MMQGRLSAPTDGRMQFFPKDRWEAEFDAAARIGFDSIEWLYDGRDAAQNPISSDQGVARILEISGAAGVKVASVCADYFRDNPWLRVDKGEFDRRVQRLSWLIERCASLGIERIVLPLLETAAINSAVDAADVAAVLERVAPEARAAGVALHLETSLAPKDFVRLLDLTPDDVVKVNDDIGNSASFGYSPIEEFMAYGSRIASVHIKDRKRSGPTVPLGSGDADYALVGECLASFEYKGDFVLEAARGTEGSEEAWALRNLDFARSWLALLPGWRR